MSNQLQSENINELLTALVKAQKSMPVAKYDGFNAHFKSKYASYDAMREANRASLSENGLVLTHFLDEVNGKRMLITQVAHISGQWMRSYLCLPQEKESPQEVGKAISYAKRYTMASLLGQCSDEDDDAESAEKPFREPERTPRNTSAPTITPMQEEDIIKLSQGNGEVVHNILKHYKCKTLADLKASDFPFIINTLQKKKEGARHEAIAS